MSSMAVDGLISGLNTTELINNLMQLEAAPQRLLKIKSADASDLVSALQALNTKAASLATTAGTVSDAASWQTSKVTSSSESVTATATDGAKASSLQFRVQSLSTGQVSVLDDLSGGDLGDPPALTVVRGGELITISPASGDLADVTAAINNATDAGLSAVAVRVSNGETPEYRLQLSGITGADNAFDVYIGDAATVQGYLDDPTSPAAVAAQLVDRSDAVVAAADATIELWSGTSDPVTLTSANNTFTDVLPGVTFTANAVTAADDPPVSLTVAQDTAAATSMVADLVNNISTVLGEVASRTESTTTTDGEGNTVVTGGILSGNSSVRFLANQVGSAFSLPVDGRSPSEVGLSIDRAGNVNFDEEAFAAAMREDPEGTQALVIGIAQRLAEVAESASDPLDGTITMQVTSQEGRVADLDRRIADWDRRLETRRLGLERTYTSLEVTLGQMQAQSSWLSSQIAGLPSMIDTMN